MKKLFISTFVFLLIYTICFSQTREKLELNKSYSLVKIYKKNNKIVKGRNLTLINDSTIRFKNNKTYKAETININDLRSIKIKSGTKALPYALYGGGTMALISLYAWLSVEADPSVEPKDNAGAIIAGYIAGGAAVGALIGLAIPKWKSISIPRKKSGKTSLYLKPVIDVQNNYYALNLHFKF